MNIFKNLYLKSLAFLSALLLWLFVVGVENYVFTTSYGLPVRAINIGQNFSVASEIPNVLVKYKSGSGSVNINSNELDLFVNLDGMASGNYNLPIEYANKSSNFTVVAVEPARIDLKLEAITTKSIPLKVSVLGSPDKEYEMKGFKSDADSVSISGAATVMSTISEFPLKISLDGTETADFSRKVTLDAHQEWEINGKSVTFDPAVAQVDIEIRKKAAVPDDGGDQGSATVNTETPSTEIPVEAGMERKTLMVEIVPADDIRSSIKELVPKNILLTLEGLPADVAALNNNSIKLVLNSSEVSNGTYHVKVADLVLPEGKDFKVITLSPEKVSVKF